MSARLPTDTALPPLDELEGMTVHDRDGEKIGTVSDTYVDREGGHPRYLAVKTGWLASKRHIIPVDDVRADDAGGARSLTVPYTRRQLEDAPSYEAHEELTERHESDVYGHFDRQGYWEAVRARQTTPAPTPEIAVAEAADAVARGDDPAGVRVKRWGVSAPRG